MNDVWVKIKFWTKLVVLGLVTLYIVIFIAKNSERTATFWYWFWGEDYQISILLLVAVAFGAGALSVFLIRTTYRTVKQFREMRRRSQQERMVRAVEDMKDKSSRLQTKPPNGETQP